MRSKSIKTLQREAGHIARGLGHRLRWVIWTYPAAPYYRHGIGSCRLCDCDIAITERPAPNGIDIGGSGIVEACRRERAGA